MADPRLITPRATSPRRPSCPEESRSKVASVTSSAGLDGEAVRDVLVLDRFSFLSVPESEAERVIEALNGRSLGGQSLSLERVKAR